MEGILHGCSALLAVPYHEAAVAWLPRYSVRSEEDLSWPAKNMKTGSVGYALLKTGGPSERS